MLTELQISNFAIIENQSIRFEQGLNVLTGETGSGKSIILSALELILGGRSSIQNIRTGHDSLEVHAHFDLSGLSPEKLSELPDIAQQEELAVSRILSRNGRGKIYINGAICTASVLQQIGNRFINICSQSQQIKLLLPEYHLELLDGFLKEEALFLSYRKAFAQWSEKQKAYSELQKKYADKETRQIWLEETVEELESLDLTEGLRESLEGRYKRLTQKEKIKEKLLHIESCFEDENGLLAVLTKTTAAIADATKVDSTFSKALDALQIAKEQIFQSDKIVKSYTTDDDNEDLEKISEKLTLLTRLERKHKTNESGLLKLLLDSKKELLLLGDSGSMTREAEELKKLSEIALKFAEQLSAKRTQAAKKLADQVSKELGELNMSGSKLSVSIERKNLSADGIDQVEFLLVSNPGEPPRPLRAIASGGELSRIMLVLKKILRDRSGVNVLVFDEVDTGISGGVARAVGQKLKVLSKDSQVICITHLPQVASYADHHLLVEKSGTKKVITVVRELLDSNDRVDEIARMLSGFEVTESTRKSAAELIATAL